MITSVTSAILGTEIICTIICLILLYGNICESHRKTDYGSMYSWLLITNIGALAFDGVSWIVDGNTALNWLNYVTNTMSIVLSFVLIAEYSLYLATYIGKRKPIPKSMVRTMLILYSLAIAVMLGACLCGAMFSIVDGIYVHKYFYDIYSVTALLALLSLLVIIVGFRKELGTHDFIATLSYILIPTFSAVINMWFPDFTFVYQASTVAMLVLFVMIQSEQGNMLVEETRASNYYATHDDLTDIFNRRAYMEKLSALEQSDENLGVLFCDINGLKHVNDNFGHVEGDRLITDFADILKDHFDMEQLFRISGDEFVVLAEETAKNDFYRMMKTLRLYNYDDDVQLASIGVQYGPAKGVKNMLIEAEKEMYTEKADFYSSHPELKKIH